MFRKLFILTMVMVLGTISPKADEIPSHSLDYKVNYQCSFINEVAAYGHVDMGCNDGVFKASISGRSVPVFGEIYYISDNLEATFTPVDVASHPQPINVLRIGGVYSKAHEGHSLSDAPYRTISGAGTLSTSAATMECVTLMADMLSVFYYAKTIDFENMAQGCPVEVEMQMPYDRQVEMEITYNGITQFGEHQVYDVVCNFSYEGTMSRYPVTFYINVSNRIPVYISADIKIGHVSMTLI